MTIFLLTRLLQHGDVVLTCSKEFLHFREAKGQRGTVSDHAVPSARREYIPNPKPAAQFFNACETNSISMQRHAKSTILQHLVRKPRSAQVILMQMLAEKEGFLFSWRQYGRSFLRALRASLRPHAPLGGAKEFLIMGAGVAYVIPAAFYFSRAELSSAMLYKLGR